MKLWWVAALGIMFAGAAALAAQPPEEWYVKGEDGHTLAVVTVCSNCQFTSRKSKACHGGAEEGWHNGKACGKCLVDSNYGTMLRHPYDLHFTGALVDRAGHPVKNRFVKMFLANGWSVRSKTSEQGRFRLMLGATAERKSKQPLVTNLGNLLDTRSGKDLEYALFLLPPGYKPCAPVSTGSGKENGAHP
jgi:hypothetical protein